MSPLMNLTFKAISGKPIMPGVLIIEAMAQSGGFLLLHTVGDPSKKLVIFSRINSAKFKK